MAGADSPQPMRPPSVRNLLDHRQTLPRKRRGTSVPHCQGPARLPPGRVATRRDPAEWKPKTAGAGNGHGKGSELNESGHFPRTAPLERLPRDLHSPPCLKDASATRAPSRHLSRWLFSCTRTHERRGCEQSLPGHRAAPRLGVPPQPRARSRGLVLGSRWERVME